MKKFFSAIAALAVLALLCGMLALPAAAADTGAYATEVLRLINAERKSAGLPALQEDAALSGAASARAKEIKKYFSHTRPDGREWYTVLKEKNIGYALAGENIAYGQKTPASVMSAWMNSKGHKQNILGDFNRVGVGVYESGGVLYWVQLFIQTPQTIRLPELIRDPVGAGMALAEEIVYRIFDEIVYWVPGLVLRVLERVLIWVF